MLNIYWVRKSIAHPSFENATKDIVIDGIKAKTAEEAIKQAFNDDVYESGVHDRMICTSSSNENGYRYWTIA